MIACGVLTWAALNDGFQQQVRDILWPVLILGAW